MSTYGARSREIAPKSKVGARIAISVSGRMVGPGAILLAPRAAELIVAIGAQVGGGVPSARSAVLDVANVTPKPRAERDRRRLLCWPDRRRYF